MHLVLVHIGEHFPAYINDCIAQLNSVLNIQIHLLIDSKHISSVTGECTRVSLEIIPMDDLHRQFEDTTKLDSYMRGGFWKYATKRFFYLYTYMKMQGLTDVFHIENDNLVYIDFTSKLSVFQQKSMWCIMDSEDRCIPGFIYVKDCPIMERLLTTCISCSTSGLNDMQALAQFQKANDDVGCLPIIHSYCDPIPCKYYEYAEAFGVLFDGACVGQYIGGVDPRNTPGDTRGFINETSIIKCNKVTIEWKDKTPYLNSLPLVNLHIHSKDLKQWM